MIDKILILSDSLALARDFPEKTKYGETWPELLKNHYPVIHQVSIGGATSTDLLKQVQYHKSFTPDLVIVQCGIVDCAPRFASKLEIDILNKLPIFGKKILKIINNPKVRNFRKITYVNPIQFRRNLTSIAKSFDCDTYFLTILPADETYSKLLPGIKENIDNYNQLIKQHQFINLENIPNSGIMTDHHHLNEIGHQYIFQNIFNFLSLRKNEKERTITT